MPSRQSVVCWTRPLLAALFLVGVSSSCKLTEPDRNSSAMLELARHRTQWQQQDIRSYTFDYEVQAFTPRSPVRIVVLNDAVYSVTVVATGEIIADKRGFPTLDDLFETGAMTLANNIYRVHIAYDAAYRFPTRIDATSQATDAGFSMLARNFDTLFLAHDNSLTR